MHSMGCFIWVRALEVAKLLNFCVGRMSSECNALFWIINPIFVEFFNFFSGRFPLHKESYYFIDHSNYILILIQIYKAYQQILDRIPHSRFMSSFQCIYSRSYSEDHAVYTDMGLQWCSWIIKSYIMINRSYSCCFCHHCVNALNENHIIRFVMLYVAIYHIIKSISFNNCGGYQSISLLMSYLNCINHL